MKTSLVAALSCGCAVLLLQPCQAQTKRTIWVPPPMGSLIGGGYVDSGEVTNPSASAARKGENPALAKALAELDAQTGTTVQGYTLISNAVALQTTVPVAKIKAQRSATNMSFSDLLVANSLAVGSGKNFNEVVAMRGNGPWDPIVRKLRIDEKSIIARAHAAAESLRYAQIKNDRNRAQNVRDNTLIHRQGGGPLGQGGG